MLEASFIVMMGAGLILLGGAFLMQRRRTIDPVSASLIVGAGVYAILWKEPVLIGAAGTGILPLEAARIGFFLLLFGAVFLWVYWLFERHVESLEETRDALVEAVERSEVYVDILSHDIRNPLAVANARLELEALEHPQATTSLAEAQDALARIERVIEHALAITGQHKSHADPTKPIPLSRIIQDRVDGLRPMAQANDIELHVDLGDAGSAPANQMIGQAIENVLANAIGWAPQGSRVDLNARLDGPVWHLRVRDRGSGIDPKEAARLFDRFERGKQASGDGVGLGLAITKRVMALHHGGVVVEIPEGPGCQIRLTVPRDWPTHRLHEANGHAEDPVIAPEPGGAA